MKAKGYDLRLWRCTPRIVLTASVAVVLSGRFSRGSEWRAPARSDTGKSGTRQLWSK